MKKTKITTILITIILLTAATVVIAKPGKGGRYHQKKIFSSLAQIDLSTEQTEKIRQLRLTYEESTADLKVQEHQLKAELDIFWLQLTPDIKTIKSSQKKIHDIKFQILEKDTEFKIAIRQVLTKDQLSRFLALGGDRYHGPDGFNHRPPRSQQPKTH